MKNLGYLSCKRTEINWNQIQLDITHINCNSELCHHQFEVLHRFIAWILKDKSKILAEKILVELWRERWETWQKSPTGGGSRVHPDKLILWQFYNHPRKTDWHSKGLTLTYEEKLDCVAVLGLLSGQQTGET